MVHSLLADTDCRNWLGLLKGNKDSFVGLYNQYFNPLYEYGIRLCNDSELVKDCVQDLFIKLWCSRSSLSQTTSVKPYLLTSLRNTILNKIEKERCIKARAYRAVKNVEFRLNYSVDSRMIEREEELSRASLIINALQQLTPRQKECIYLRFYSGLEYMEIAEIMNISLKATYKIVGRAIGVLRINLKESVPYFVGLLAFVFPALSNSGICYLSFI